MEIGTPIEAQCVRLWKTVFGHKRMTDDEARGQFWAQNPAVIDGWKKLAKKINKVTTHQTMEHLEEEP